MARNEYTTPIFGQQSFVPWSPKPLDTFTKMPIQNRSSAVKRNEKGQVYAADMFWNYTDHTQAALTARTIQTGNYIMQRTLESQSNMPIAILAVPMIYGNLPGTALNESSDEYWWRVVKFHENTNYLYFVVALTGGASIQATYNNVVPSTGQKISVSYITQQILFAEAGYGVEPEVERVFKELERDGFATDRLITPNRSIESEFNIRVEQVSVQSKVRAGTQEYGRIADGTVASIKSAISHWKERTDSVYSRVIMMEAGSYMDSLNMSASTNFIGSFIATGFPVFNASTSFDEMVKYFQGEAYEADNQEPPPDDWSTDWDVYVKGVQRPDIFITMKSPKIDEWLTSDKNTSGVKKEDIAVEYRYREYEDPSLPYTLVQYAKDKYDQTRETDYISNISLNYLNLKSLIEEIGTGNIETLYPYYAEMEFRLKYGDYASAWCRYEIGAIGSPSVSDFTFMKNLGEQADDFQDESTVTLHYDEFPPDYDPWPDRPLPPLPPIEPTEPTPVPPGLNGIGLLTTTYNITQNTARQLGQFFWGGDIFEKIKALNTSPIENVVGLMIMPIMISGTSAVIRVGDVDTNLNGDVITSVPLYRLGSIELKGRYQSFLDYEPYTSAFIFLPFVGFVRIDPAYYTNRTLSVVYSYDIICGLCNAMLFADGIYIESHQGNCGISVPLIATNRADLQIGLASSLLETAAMAASGGLAGAATGKTIAGSAAGLVSAADQYMTGFHSMRQGGYSPSCAWAETRECYLVIESANAAHSSTYNKDRGRPTLASANVGSLRGYTETDANVDLSGLSGATEEEKNEIRKIFASGFYV